MNERMNVYDLLFSSWLVAPAPFTLRKGNDICKHAHTFLAFILFQFI